jgi:hypothetical protein
MSACVGRESCLNDAISTVMVALSRAASRSSETGIGCLPGPYGDGTYVSVGVSVPCE